MKTEALEISERIERVLSSEQWNAIKNSFSSRLDVASTTSLSINEKLVHGKLSILLNFEKRGDGLHLITYKGKLIPDAEVKLETNGKNMSTVERLFNAQGKYVFSFREAINLLEGRAVLKSYVSMDGIAKEGWFMADRNAVESDNRFYFSGGQSILSKYDLEDAVMKLPLADLGVGEKSELIRDLECGDLQLVKLQLNGKEVNRYIQADPVMKGVSLFEGQMKPLNIGRFVPEQKKVQRKARHNGLSMDRLR